eukprot:TRINITY_DN7140_c0_g1_i1.p1 TRINITY_DN7140_c0_g1~~TRINITY_DN7140_c0_g1_i1.p1  ORF type:complete len:581 (-),score=139.48 TRINITY_DN7140_c0_g1_i1:8-1750(-)
MATQPVGRRFGRMESKPEPLLSTSRRVQRIRQEYSTVNPFLNETPDLWATPSEFVKTVLCGLTLFPIRFLFILLFLCMAWLLAFIATFGLADPKKEKKKSDGESKKNDDGDDDEAGESDHLPPQLAQWRKNTVYPIRWIARAILFVLGYYWIPRKGSVDPRAAIVCPNHISFPEAIYMVSCGVFSTVSKAENADLPIIGTVMKAFQCICVDRHSPTSRLDTKNAIIARAKAHETGKTPILLFPEGTTTNGKCLIAFKLGAFYAGCPVQPVAIRYPHLNFDNSLVVCDLGILVFRTMCQFVNFLEVEFLPVVFPSVAEKADPKLFAKHVRQDMALALNVPCTEHTFSDVILQLDAAKQNLPTQAAVVETGIFLKQFSQLSLDGVRELMSKFSEIDVDNSGSVTVNEFAAALSLPPNEIVQRVFDLFDINDNGQIEFREFIMGLAFMARNEGENVHDVVKFCFNTFDTNEDGYVDRDELLVIMRKGFPNIDKESVNKLFDSADVDGKGILDYHTFAEFLKNNPVYLKLFQKYQSMTTTATEESTEEEIITTTATTMATTTAAAAVEVTTTPTWDGYSVSSSG